MMYVPPDFRSIINGRIGRTDGVALDLCVGRFAKGQFRAGCLWRGRQFPGQCRMDSAHDRWYLSSFLFLTGVSAGKEDIVDRLLEIPATDTTIQNRSGATALYTIHPSSL